MRLGQKLNSCSLGQQGEDQLREEARRCPTANGLRLAAERTQRRVQSSEGSSYAAGG